MELKGAMTLVFWPVLCFFHPGFDMTCIDPLLRVCVYFLNVKNCWPHLDRIYYIWYSKCFGESLAKVKGKTILLVYFLLILQATAPLASVFIAVQHNATDMETTETPMTYTYGNKDLAAVFFYSLISIVMHAIIQEYVLDVSICL